METCKIKTINNETLDFFEDDNKPPGRGGIEHRVNKPKQWVIDVLECKE